MKVVELEITPEPSDAEREAILAALRKSAGDTEPPIDDGESGEEE